MSNLESGASPRVCYLVPKGSIPPRPVADKGPHGTSVLIGRAEIYALADRFKTLSPCPRNVEAFRDERDDMLEKLLDWATRGLDA